MKLVVEARELDAVTNLWSQLQASLQKIGVAPSAGKASTIADEIGEEGVRRQKKMIEVGRRIDTGDKFAALDLLYRERKAKAGKGGEPILVWDRTMLKSITYTPSGRAITIGPTDPKARYHASLEPRGRIPLRDFVTLPDSFYEWAEERVLEGAVLLFERRLGVDSGASLSRAA